MSWIMTAFVLLSGFQALASIDKIETDQLSGSNSRINVHEATYNKIHGRMELNSAEHISPGEFACLAKQIELLSAALERSVNKSRLGRFGNFSSLEISAYIPRNDEAVDRIGSGLYVNGGTLSLSIKLGRGESCGLMSGTELETQFQKIEVLSNGIRLSFSTPAELKSATDTLKGNANAIIQKIGNLRE